MYGSPDRQMRLILLENMDKYIDKIAEHPKIINDKIFPQIVCIIMNKLFILCNNNNNMLKLKRNNYIN